MQITVYIYILFFKKNAETTTDTFRPECSPLKQRSITLDSIQIDFNKYLFY